MGPQEREAPPAPQSEGTTTGQSPLWQALKSLEAQVRREGADIHPSDMAKALGRLADDARADLVREWHRGHETGISEERERIRRVLERHCSELRDKHLSWSKCVVNLTQQAHKAAEAEAEARAQADAVEAAIASLSEGEGR